MLRFALYKFVGFNSSIGNPLEVAHFVEHCLINDHRTLSRMANSLKVAQGMKSGPVTVGSVCTGWGVGDMVVDALNEHLLAYASNDPEGSLIPKAGPKCVCGIVGVFKIIVSPRFYM